MRQVAVLAGLLWCGSAGGQSVPSEAGWPGLGGDQARSGARQAAVGSFATPRWTLSRTASGQAIQFVGPAGVAATTTPLARVFATAIVGGQTTAVAVDAEDGSIAWMAALPGLVLGSWSSPAVDAAAGTVLFAAGASVTALRAADGSVAWRADLDGPPVNVSPVVTDDLGLANRAFVTTYGGFGGPSVLTCVNVSPRHPRTNPYDPGEVVWSASIGSATSATPTYLDGVVYVCSTGLDGDGRGQIRAFDARATQTPAPTWVFTNPLAAEAAFSGVTAHEGPDGPAVYAASYVYAGGLDAANLVKVDARTGALRWSVPCNRTNSIPVVLDDGRVALSGGITGFGTVPTVELFQDHGTHAERLWDTATATWVDANHNGQMNAGEFLLVGGWTTHPLAAREGGRLVVGAISGSADFLTPYQRLFELDLSVTPGDAGFVVQETDRAGSTPAMLGSGVYSAGPAGLAALGPPPPRPDVDGNGRVDVDDLYAWEGGVGFRDVDRSGVVDGADRDFLLYELRRNEARELREGRR